MAFNFVKKETSLIGYIRGTGRQVIISCFLRSGKILVATKLMLIAVWEQL
jgi:hypothetical protein